MKTAEEYFDEYMHPVGWLTFANINGNQKRRAVTQMVSAIAADARADALAEKSVAPDADEERAKREYERFRNGHTVYPEWKLVGPTLQEVWRDYVKTLPPRPVRSPGQRLADALREVDFMSGKLSECAEAKFERAATALGIKPQE